MSPERERRSNLVVAVKCLRRAASGDTDRDRHEDLNRAYRMMLAAGISRNDPMLAVLLINGPCDEPTDGELTQLESRLRSMCEPVTTERAAA